MTIYLAKAATQAYNIYYHFTHLFLFTNNLFLSLIGNISHIATPPITFPFNPEYLLYYINTSSSYLLIVSIPDFITILNRNYNGWSILVFLDNFLTIWQAYPDWLRITGCQQGCYCSWNQGYVCFFFVLIALQLKFFGILATHSLLVLLLLKSCIEIQWNRVQWNRAQCLLIYTNYLFY